jgi:hypothetical protein
MRTLYHHDGYYEVSSKGTWADAAFQRVREIEPGFKVPE